MNVKVFKYVYLIYRDQTPTWSTLRLRESRLNHLGNLQVMIKLLRVLNNCVKRLHVLFCKIIIHTSILHPHLHFKKALK